MENKGKYVISPDDMNNINNENNPLLVGNQNEGAEDGHVDAEGWDANEYFHDQKSSSKHVMRHKFGQIEELESFYQDCDKPDDKTCLVLGTLIGLEARQVRTWFQNRRSQEKKKAVLLENQAIQQENAELLAENKALREVMLTKACATCGEAMFHFPTVDPSLEKLREELVRRSIPLGSIPPPGLQQQPASCHPDHSALNTTGAALLQLAEAAMAELCMLAAAQGNEATWVASPLGGEVLNQQVYQEKMFPPGFAVEATRATASVWATADDLVGILADAGRWSEMFPGIVAGAAGGNVVSAGISATCDGRIQLMNAELWVPSPRVRNRKMSFLRFTKQTAERQWAVVDVSIDSIVAQQQGGHGFNTGCRLLPSGCLIHDLNNGQCKVTWIVHAEYDETAIPTVFRPLFSSGRALGACRWLSSLQRQCGHLAVLRSIPDGDGKGRRGALELAQRMMAAFYAAVSGPVANSSGSNITDGWNGGTGAIGGPTRFEEAVRMVTWKKTNSLAGEPTGMVLSCTATVWLPGTPPHLVFDYLCNEQRRAEWDDLCASAAAVEVLGFLATPGNAVSVLNAHVVSGGSRKKQLILQQACSDESCSLVVYAPVTEEAMLAVMNGTGDHDTVFVLPSGFAILPDGHGHCQPPLVVTDAPSSSSAPHRKSSSSTATGSLLTVARQVLLPSGVAPPSDGNRAAGIYVGSVLCNTISKIKAAVRASSANPV